MNLLSPDPASFKIEDIAHALAHLCRFTGHTKCFYSVAQHSVMVSYLVPEEDALLALLHDATEAYLGDVSSPLKALIPDYKKIEDNMSKAILLHFTGKEYLPLSVKEADSMVLNDEMTDLIEGYQNNESRRTWEPKIIGWSPTRAKRSFLIRYRSLAG